MNIKKLAISAAALALTAALAAPASATDVRVAVEAWTVGFQDQRTTISDSLVDGDSTLLVRNGVVNIHANSDADDRINVDVEAYTAGYQRQITEIQGVTVSNGSVLAVEQGVLNLSLN